MATVRFLLCLLVAWCCAALVILVPPAHARVGLVGGFGGRDNPAAAGFLHVGSESKQQQQPRGGGGSRYAWWSPPAWNEELRSVPAGPDPLHHHGSPRRPEQEPEHLP
ncbi:hypothetical protein ZWY2020_052054 [Hordeum vulgare]|nr:hypothetical protein ZWY2020_052054 [Hordeum vulgare]